MRAPAHFFLRAMSSMPRAGDGAFRLPHACRLMHVQLLDRFA
jgi:hypothetical protein